MKNLVKILTLFALCLCGLLSCPGSALAQFDGDPEVPVLVQNADAVCVAKVVAVTQVTPTKFEARHHGRGGLPVFIDAQSAVAEVAVQSVLKGKISPKSITVAFYKNVPEGLNPTPFTELAAGETDIIFLKATDNEANFTLSQPSSHGKSKITIGDAKIGPTPADISPLRAVLLVLADALTGGSKPVKLECLDRIGSAGVLLYVKTDVWVDKGAVARRTALGEPLMADNPSSSLEAFIRAKVLPTVLKLTTDSDADVRDQAVLAAGNLQDVGIIPALAKLADKQYKPGEQGIAASIFREYRNPDATRALVGVLGDSNPNVRSQAAAALRESADPVAVPALLEHLDDPDPDARYYIVTALYTATDTPQYPGTVLFHADEDKYVSLMRKWADEHQDKVAALQEQFLAPLTLKALPLKPAPLKPAPLKPAH